MLVAVVLARGRRVSRQPGAFRGVIRVTGGEVPGLGMKWRRGDGRWVREILVWTTAPFLFRDELVVADAAAGAVRAADPGEGEAWWESMRRLWRWPPAAARGVGSLFRQMGVSELPGCLRWEGE